MRLKIPKEDAIRIIHDRIKDLNAFDFDPKVWKDRTVLDLKSIFPSYEQWLNISTIHFDTFITAEKAQKLREGKETARKLLSSYIDQINEYSGIAAKKVAAAEETYREKYNDLLDEWNALVPKYEELQNNYTMP